MNILNIHQAVKSYRGKKVLKGLNITHEEGLVLGLIGENGVGKTTLIKALLNLVRLNGGKIDIFGKDNQRFEKEIREKIGFVHESSYLFDDLTLRDTERILRAGYQNWDTGQFHQYLNRLEIPSDNKFKTFSKGMKMRTALAIALSHHAELIIMDEPTAGLDPVIRHDLYRIIREELSTENRSFIISTHITSDLEQVADYIALLQDGVISLHLSMDQLREEYAVCKGPLEMLKPDNKELFLGYLSTPFGFTGLTDKPGAASTAFGNTVIYERPTIEDLMVYTHAKALPI